MKKIEVCPGNLAAGFDKYCPFCIKHLFDGKRVSPVLDFDNDADSADLVQGINQLSVSGVQEKLSATVDAGRIVLTPSGERGRYIIKPAPAYKHLRLREQIPPNEHLTMQIARQVYKIPTAENGLVFFRSGEIAYITKRFAWQQLQIYGQLRRCGRVVENLCFGMAGADEPLLRVDRLQLSFRQWGRTFEELFVAANHKRRLPACSGIRLTEYFAARTG